MRKEARRIVEEMPVPRPFDLDGLVANIAAARGRSIRLVPLPDRLLGSTGLCGLWLKHETLPLDLILHVESTTRFHREKIILHELGHLWCDDADGVTSQVLDRVAGDPSAELVDRLIGRGQAAARRRYGTREEARAETVADLIHHIAYSDEFIEDGALRALDDTLTHPGRSPRD
ncbi:hypothetical protein ACFC0M_13125 [Streptomyces sp. NPDC056149]|uniref:hypothetical protein n=1 Tax=unclassified Streptomyces TaxID=2593676 RepID=UPI002381348A|nr:hypothetical protein [Streptomyces sp. WZ-12]